MILQNGRAFDPAGNPTAAAAEVRALCDAGATAIAVRLVHHSPGHHIEQMAAMVELTASVTAGAGPSDPGRPVRTVPPAAG